MSNFSHPVKDGPLEIHYSEKRGHAELHKAGCKHAADSKSPFSGRVGADDYFLVAPCARKRRQTREEHHDGT